MVDGSIEVLTVDDGSTDRTPELADALAAAIRGSASTTRRTAATAGPSRRVREASG